MDEHHCPLCHGHMCVSYDAGPKRTGCDTSGCPGELIIVHDKSIDVQLEAWVRGEPKHNEGRDECCPDFSCCRGIEHIAPVEERQRYAKAVSDGDEETMMQMLTGFLAKALAEEAKDTQVHIAGYVTDPDKLH